MPTVLKKNNIYRNAIKMELKLTLQINAFQKTINCMEKLI